MRSILSARHHHNASSSEEDSVSLPSPNNRLLDSSTDKSVATQQQQQRPGKTPFSPTSVLTTATLSPHVVAVVAFERKKWVSRVVALVVAFCVLQLFWASNLFSLEINQVKLNEHQQRFPSTEETSPMLPLPYNTYWSNIQYRKCNDFHVRDFESLVCIILTILTL
jgi:hypothetical protein